MERCWILVGMMGVGKSAVGRSLAVASGREFVDTDLLLQNRLGRSVSQLFSIYGEDAFRDHESAILRGLQPSYAVLSTGGGIVLRDENWEEMRRLGTTIYLDASAEVLIERLTLSKKKRPLLQTENWEDKLRSVLAAREERYLKADIHVQLRSHNIDEACQQVLCALQEAAR